MNYYTKLIIEIEELSTWVQTFGINTSNTRLAYYIKFLTKFNQQKKYYPKNNNKDREVLTELFYILREIHELTWIYSGFKNKNIQGTKELLKIIIGGHNYSKDDKKTVARNYQLELRIASYFTQKDYLIDLTQRTDLIIKKFNYTFYIECKRLYSESKIDTRIKEASKQLSIVTKKNKLLKKNLGIAVFDVTKIAYPHLGLTWGFSNIERQKNIQDKLIKISKEYDFTTPFKNNKNNILVWIQIIMPSLDLTTGRHETRFSSYFLPLSSKYTINSKPYKIFQEAITNI